MKSNKQKFPTPKKSGEFSQKTDISSIIRREVHTGAKRPDFLPELLSPAGSLDSLIAAANAGADAVYFGGGTHNARINAHNFTNEELEYGIKLLHSVGKRAYITLNTLLYEKEAKAYLDFAEQLYLYGADALIVADLGGAEMIHRHIPDFELHASTQMSGHNVAQAKVLKELGFSRMVLARETPKEDIEYFVKNSPIESEVFVHGALCVCHSGQCLFSSLVGGRSGNRGECAQPCRLPDKWGNYPLSLKDLSLANHIKELVSSGTHSLKIEGRMKAPEYVWGVTKAFRALLDMGDNATERELRELSKIFSRGGFTDGYFERKISFSMLGVRSERDKSASREIVLSASEDITSLNKIKTPVSVSAEIKANAPCRLKISTDKASAVLFGQIPDRAINAPLSYENVKKSLCKLGDTDFALEKFELELDEGLILPVSALNALRRSACEELSKILEKRTERVLQKTPYIQKSSDSERKEKRSARFLSPEQIPENAKEFFNIIYLPLEKFDGSTEGVILPPVIFDSERKNVEKMLSGAAERGAKYALVGNLGALELAKRYALVPVGDFRLNVYNGETVSSLENMGFSEIILSPELTLPQMRDIKGDVSSIVYGRIPLMLLEKCVIKEISSCEICKSGKAELLDRRGAAFPVFREGEHRNVIYNSLPTYMADRQNELKKANIKNQHFIFSGETKDECSRIISAYQSALSAEAPVRRI